MHRMRGFTFIFLIILLTSFAIIGVNSGEQPSMLSRSDSQYKTYTPSDYTPHRPIIITSNSDFVDQGWPGTGSLHNPYIIEGLSITSDEDCIRIWNTDVYFEIRNCLLTSDDETTWSGILLWRVSHGKIVNCFAELHTCGYNFWNCSDCNVSSSTARDNSEIGFRCSESTNCNMFDNIAIDNLYGFSISRSYSCTMINNILTNNGLQVGGDSLSQFMHDLSDNQVNGLPLGFFQSIADSEIDTTQYGQILLVNCSNVTVRNGTFTKIGLHLAYCVHCTLLNNSAIDCGFSLFRCPYSTLINNTAFHSRWHGFVLTCCDSSTVINNTASNSHWDGFYLDNSYNVTLMNNAVYNIHYYGFRLLGLSYCKIMHNTVSNTTDSGFYFYSCHYCNLTDNIARQSTNKGFNFYRCSYCRIHNNIYEGSESEISEVGFSLMYCNSCTLMQDAATNNYIGFYLVNSSFSILNDNLAANCHIGISLTQGSSSCKLTNNMIIENEYGVFIYDSCSSNLIYLNHFANNTESNGYDNGSLNNWDNGIYGNFWDDYYGVGNYSIAGSAGSVDNHPYVYGTVLPTISTTTTTTTTNSGDSNYRLIIIISGFSIGLVVVICPALFWTVRQKRLQISIFRIDFID